MDGFPRIPPIPNPRPSQARGPDCGERFPNGGERGGALRGDGRFKQPSYVVAIRVAYVVATRVS